jgi:predicted transcriptional regulator
MGVMVPKYDAIISIHPHYASAILDGAKTVELRRKIPSLETGTRLWIYATRPTCAVVGFAVLGSVVKAHPESIWDRFQSNAAIGHNEFQEYFNGASQAVALCLLDAQRSFTSVSLLQLRSLRSGFHPPQVTLAITTLEADILYKLAFGVEQRIAS